MLSFVPWTNLDSAAMKISSVSAFSRYLTCPRDNSSSAVEQVASLFEPFLKKLAFLFDVRGATGNSIWGSGLNDLLPKMLLATADLKNQDASYWGTQKTEDAVLRVAFQLRHTAAHEAHDHPFFERERNAYYVFAAMLIASLTLIKTNSKVLDVVNHQGHVDYVRDLLVKVEGVSRRVRMDRGSTWISLQILLASGSC